MKLCCQKLQSWNEATESCTRHFPTKKAGVKCWQNWPQWSISSTFYSQILRMKVRSKPNSKQRKDVRTKKVHVKCWRNWPQWSISSTFYPQILPMKVRSKPNSKQRKDVRMKKERVKRWWHWHLNEDRMVIRSVNLSGPQDSS